LTVFAEVPLKSLEEELKALAHQTGPEALGARLVIFWILKGGAPASEILKMREAA